MEKSFRPEFLNRVDEIIVFRSLTREDLKQIVDIELRKRKMPDREEHEADRPPRRPRT